MNQPAISSKRTRIIIAVIVAVLAWSVYTRVEKYLALNHGSDGNHVVTAIVATPEATAASDGLVLPGELHPYLEAAIYARTSGYLKRRMVELGATVKSGAVLAEIDSPETDQQLKQAEADLVTAEANYKVAQTTAERWKNLLPTNYVSKQDVDLKVAEADAKKAMVASAKANVDRLRELEGYKSVVAPFDGVITARNIDVGTLISAGNGATPELFHIADLRKLRVIVNVPQQQALRVKVGMTATLVLPEQPGQKIPAKLIRSAGAIDESSHTLLAELEVDNHNGQLLPGGYCEVHLPLSSAGSLRVPASALIFGSDGTKVATVDANSAVTIKAVTVGNDFGKQVEIVAGITAQDKMIINPWDSIREGQVVNVTEAASSKDNGQKK